MHNSIPNFIGIGAPRTGTSWLYNMLYLHPAVWLPPIKELHYFDTKYKLYSRNKLSKHGRKIIGRYLYRQPELLPWFINYLFKPEGDDWYRSLFAHGAKKGLITGEITPAYGHLPEAGFQEIKSINPEVKIIFTMRNPITRSWSAIVKNLARKKGKSIKDVPQSEMLAHLKRSTLISRNNYLYTVETLDKTFARSQICYLFYDLLLEDPKDYLSKVLAFLDLDWLDSYDHIIHQQFNTAGSDQDIPLTVKRAVAKDYYEMITSLCNIFGGYPCQWRREMEALID